MMRRMSRRLAARSSRAPPRSSSASCASSMSSSPVRVSLATVIFLPRSDEEQAHDAGQPEQREGQDLGRPVPAAVRAPRWVLLRRHPVHEALELLDGLGVGHEGHADRHDRVEAEGDDRGPERLREVRAEREDARLVEDVGAEGADAAGDHAPEAGPRRHPLPEHAMKNVANSGTLNTENSTWM